MRVRVSNRIFSSIIILLIFLAISISLSINFINGISKRLFDEVISRIISDTKANSNILVHRMNEYLNEVKAIAKGLNLVDFSKDEVLDYLRNYNSNYFIRFLYCDLNEAVAYTTENFFFKIQDELTYKKLTTGFSTISRQPVDIDYFDDYLIAFSSPVNLVGNGKYAISGCIFVDNLVSQLSEFFSEGRGYSLIVSKHGEVLINSPNEPPAMFENIFEQLIPEEKLKTTMLDFSNDISDVIYFTTDDKKTKIISYAPIEGVNDWFLCMVIPDYVRSQNALGIINSMLYLFVFSIAGMIAYSIHLSIADFKRIVIIEKLAFYDQLTNVRNLNKFKVDASKLIKNFARTYRLAIIRLDLDKFRTINDMYGFEEGNKVLKNIVSALQKSLQDIEIFARIMNDDFVLLCKYISDEELLERKDRFLHRFSRIHEFTKYKYKLDFSMGICRITGDDTDITKILDKATMAHKAAKLRGGNSYVFYDDSIRDREIRIKEIENTMFDALARGEFVVYIQPKYNLNSMKIGGAESLVRWKNNYKGIILPGEFIPIFEKNGFVINIDRYMLEETCKYLRSLIDKGIEPVPISVNQSKLHINNEKYVEDVVSIVKKYNIPPSLIELELTETVMHDNIDTLIHIIERLNGHGFVISIDDFGSGYSSLNLLKEINANVLKIDREFLQNSEENQRGIAVLANIIRLAKELNMQTVTEGVETKAQEILLKQLGCDMVQGFLYAKPMPLSELETLLKLQSQYENF